MLGAIWLYTSDVERDLRFYRDLLELPLIGRDGPVAHFDAENVRLSLHPWEGGPTRPTGCFLVFVVEDVDARVNELGRRGVEFDVRDNPYGRTAEFRDPEGHELFLWQLPEPGTAEYDNVKPLVEYYERLANR